MLHRSNAVPKKSYAFVFFFGVVPSRKLFISELCLLGENFGVMPFGVVTTLVFRSYASPPFFSQPWRQVDTPPLLFPS